MVSLSLFHSLSLTLFLSFQSALSCMWPDGYIKLTHLCVSLSALASAVKHSQYHNHKYTIPSSLICKRVPLLCEILSVHGQPWPTLIKDTRKVLFQHKVWATPNLLYCVSQSCCWSASAYFIVKENSKQFTKVVKCFEHAVLEKLSLGTTALDCAANLFDKLQLICLEPSYAFLHPNFKIKTIKNVKR